MSHFEECYSQVLVNEGVYDNDPNDTGGETVFGISRNNFPKWEGWSYVDALKCTYGTGSEFRNQLKQHNVLNTLKRQWYKENFWDKFDLDKISDYPLAYEVFDQAVNLGVGRTTKLIQQACNALNYQYVFGADLIIDGKIGPMTRARFVEVGNNTKYTDVLRKALDGLQVSHYINLGLSNSSRSNYRKYMRGWLRTRVGKFTTDGEQ